jgi:hypothetical protein
MANVTKHPEAPTPISIPDRAGLRALAARLLGRAPSAQPKPRRMSAAQKRAASNRAEFTRGQ